MREDISLCENPRISLGSIRATQVTHSYAQLCAHAAPNFVHQNSQFLRSVVAELSSANLHLPRQGLSAEYKKV